MIKLINGDCLEQLKHLPDASVDSVVTDPPYELGFMNRTWDKSGIANNVALWSEVLRVLKPGGHLLAFSSTRTSHRMVSAIEDAGFEIRDTVMYIYGTGFPKNHDISKAIDKAAPDRAKQWKGWGTALKPAFEPICLARKPLSENTIAANVLQHGTGGLNIDGCRVGAGEVVPGGGKSKRGAQGGGIYGDGKAERNAPSHTQGRWPANLIHDGSEEVRAMFPEAKGQQGDLTGHTSTRQSPNGCFGKMAPALDHLARVESDKSAARFFYCAKASKQDRNEGCEALEEKQYSHDGREVAIDNAYQRNASKSGNHHPTVKPTELMRYLIKLITPPQGVVLDPFMGSGSTGKAAALDGFSFIGIELDEEYVAIAEARINFALDSLADDGVLW